MKEEISEEDIEMGEVGREESELERKEVKNQKSEEKE